MGNYELSTLNATFSDFCNWSCQKRIEKKILLYESKAKAELFKECLLQSCEMLRALKIRNRCGMTIDEAVIGEFRFFMKEMTEIVMSFQGNLVPFQYEAEARRMKRLFLIVFEGKTWHEIDRYCDTVIPFLLEARG